MSQAVFLLFASIGLILSGCSTIASSINYTQGTECLEQGDYQGAIKHLEKAVELDPTMSRNQNNLCIAYLKVGNMEKAWYHSRQAVYHAREATPANFVFYQIYKDYVRNRGLDTEGTSIQDVISKLGEPDVLIYVEEKTICIYGICTMEFRHGKLIRCEDGLSCTSLLQKA